MNINHSHMRYDDDESRMEELRELFALLDEKEKETENLVKQIDYSCFDHIVIALEQALNAIGGRRSFYTLCRDRTTVVETISLPLFKVLNAFRKHLVILRIVPNSNSLISRFKHIIRTYQMIRYPNHLVVIQPKLQSINTIEA